MDINIYCDESCHLNKDRQKNMVLGSLRVPKNKANFYFKEIRKIKEFHNLNPNMEIKWVKVSNSKISFYTELINFFLKEEELKFRGIIANKTNLDHVRFNQSHDDWYYKMHYTLLKEILDIKNNYYIYMDIKDTRGEWKRQKLKQILENNFPNTIKRIQGVSSKEVELLQLTDLLIGLIVYFKRDVFKNTGKKDLVSLFSKYYGHYMGGNNSPHYEKKFNIFHWGSINGN